MPDLSFNQVDDNLPAGAIIDDAANTDVKISVKALLGEPAVSLADGKISEFVSKFLDACSKAQSSYNTAQAVDLNSYPAPIPGIPVQDDQGNWYATFTHTVSVNVPLNRNETSGVIL